jgi:hypothetical protein
MPFTHSLRVFQKTFKRFKAFKTLLPFALGLIVVSSIASGMSSGGFSTAMAKEDDEEPMLEINGRVLDFQGSPIHGIPIRLLNEDGAELGKAQSGKDGAFVISHKKCQSCSLQILPPLKSGLASAFINNIPGAADRHDQFTLQRGFLVSGRVVGGGKGLKGLVVKVSAPADENNAKHIHTGGLAVTKGNGEFEMNLTAGVKRMLVKNNEYHVFARKHEYDFNVTSEMRLPDIEMPFAK